jgi:hypothetical protein
LRFVTHASMAGMAGMAAVSAGNIEILDEGFIRVQVQMQMQMETWMADIHMCAYSGSKNR